MGGENERAEERAGSPNRGVAARKTAMAARTRRMRGGDRRQTDAQCCADAAWSSFESVTTVWTGGLRATDQAEKTPTKPAVMLNASALVKSNTLGSFRRSGVGFTVAVLRNVAQP